MLTLKQIKPVFKFITKGASRPMLQNVHVDKDGIRCTNLESTLLIKDNYGLDDGLHVIDTIGLVGAVDQDCGDYPWCSLDIVARDIQHTRVSTIKDVRQFSSKDETRVHLNGVAFDSNHIVAVDGYCLRYYPVQNLEGSYIIPNSGIDILLKLTGKYRIKAVDIQLSDEYALIDNDYFTLLIRLIKRDYVKWRQVIPKDFSYTVTICEWIDFKEIKPLFDKREYKCKIEMLEGVISLVVKENSYIIGWCDKELSKEIGFNGMFLDKAIGKNKEIELKFNNEVAPCLVNGAIIIPLKV